MENAIMGVVGTIVVASFLIIVLVAGLYFITMKIRSWNQVASKKFISADEAAQIKQQNESIHAQLKQLNAK